jgi:hypothetical protein
MRKGTNLLTMCLAGLASTVGIVAFFAWLPSLSLRATVADGSWIANPGFEGVFTERDTELWIGDGWELWYTTEGGEAGIDRPKAFAETSRVREGLQSQRVEAQNSSHIFDACLYQQVSGITVGEYIRFSAWAYVDAGSMLDSPEKWQTRVGIDPNGGTDPRDINHYLYPSLWDLVSDKGQWQHLSVVLKATSPTVTAYACAHPTLRTSFHVYWDDAEFAVSSEKRAYVPVVLRDFIGSGALANPDLEEDYGSYKGYQQVPEVGFKYRFAPYWLPFHNDDYHDGQNMQPECGEILVGQASHRVYSGEAAQQCGLSGGGNFEAGIYQVVNGTQVSDTLRFSIWGLGWNQKRLNEDPYDEFTSDYIVTGGLRFKVGIDPYGGTDWTSTDIVWSDPIDPYDAWTYMEVTTTARYTQASVWAYAHPEAYWLRWNQAFWDRAHLELSGSP